MSFPSFAEFFESVHGFEPFPWQVRLAERVCAKGWPRLLDLPTGVGKTSVLDVALFHLATCPEQAPRRVFLVVDRRIVVDQGALHARVVLQKLRDGASPAIAAALCRLSHGGQTTSGAGGDADPFAVAVLRGGMPREEEWAKRPDQPIVGLSTVDQLGSRLLFRGYGVSRRMASVHAGLLGNDTLLLLDEVHLARPFEQTLDAIKERWRAGALNDRFSVVRMSATPGSEASGAFRLDAADQAHPRLSQRLRASKEARLVEVRVSGEEDRRRRAFAKRCADEAMGLHAQGAQVVGIVVNRVDTAREVWRLLDAAAEDRFDAVLLTGRMRPLDRDEVLSGSSGVLARAGAGRNRNADASKPLFLVATQCIEAGADLDLDALVSECASLDALRQRFGRLNRLGEIRSADSVVLIRSDHARPKKADPVYGESLAKTWDWLCSRGDKIDFGIDALDQVFASEGGTPTACLPERARAPILLPSHLDAWAQTSAPIYPDPDVSLWLHGLDTSSPEVQIVWRADLSEEELRQGADDQSIVDERITPLLAACPPSTLEAVSVPIYAARAWLRSALVPEVDDATNRSGERLDSARAISEPKLVVRWFGDRAQVSNSPEPGDTVVVPATRGGLLGANWDPTCEIAVTDLGDIAQLEGRGRAMLRTDPGVLQAWEFEELPPDLSRDEDLDPRTVLQAWVARTSLRAGSRNAERWKRVRGALQQSPRVIELPNGHFAVIARTQRPVDVTTEDDDGSFLEREVTLAAHCEDVKTWAERFLHSLRIDGAVAQDVALAAWLHDVGKADPRFQLWLADGNPMRQALLQAPLAKSLASTRDRRSREIARKRANYPRGYRHELLSVAMVERSDEILARANDADLVLHLVASHHGWCRPFAPPQDDPDDLQVALEHGGVALRAGTRHGMAALDSSVSERFWTLTDRYGWWGLAWLEAILRLADHRASEEATS